MPRASDLRRKGANSERLKSFAAATLLISILDAFFLQKSEDNTVKLTAFMGHTQKEFTAPELLDLAQPLGDWLMSLPKDIWNDKMRQINLLK